MNIYGVTFEDNDENTIRFKYPFINNEEMGKVFKKIQNEEPYELLPAKTNCEGFIKVMKILRLYGKFLTGELETNVIYKIINSQVAILSLLILFLQTMNFLL